MSLLPIFVVDFCVLGHRQLAARFSQRLEDVRKGREEAPTYSASFIEIRKEFHSLKWPPVATKKRRVVKK